MEKQPDLTLISQLGEGQTIEFKESPTKGLAREMVAFANAEGGTIYCGITDQGLIVGTSTDNRTISAIYDIARNCEPSITVKATVLPQKVIAINVETGNEKPYQCSEGFFIRNGPNAQKLKSSEIRKLLRTLPFFFDTAVNPEASIPNALSKEALKRYLALANITSSGLSNSDLLVNLQLAYPPKNEQAPFLLSNAGVLLLTKTPKRYLPEALITAVRYAGNDKFSIIDRKEFDGTLLEQVEGALDFLLRHTSVNYTINQSARRTETYEYPPVALRELLTNAVIHRDYSFLNSCIYVHLFKDRLEIENPGGLVGGLAPEEIFSRSVRRNPVLADLLYRAGYGEKLGSGLIRIQSALSDNGNPPLILSHSNFFSVRLLPHVGDSDNLLNDHQLSILSTIKGAGRPLSSRALAEHLKVSTTTITREVAVLLDKELIEKIGQGRSTLYKVKQ